MGYDNQITPKQFETLCQVESFQKSRCYSATIGELAESLNVSRTTAYEHIASLREKGLLARSTGKARCLKLTSRGERLLEEARRIEVEQADYRSQEYPPVSSKIVYLRGTVSAGYGIEAIQEQVPFSLPDMFGHTDNLFVLRVSGRSMIDAGIADGDYVICRQAPTADNGQIVIALFEDNQATMKRFFKDANAARLMPENDAFEPIFSTSCRIQAIVIGVVKRL